MRGGTQTVVLLVVAFVAGCGGSAKSNGETSKPAAQILADAKQAATSASAVHYYGTIVDSGNRLTIDLRIDGHKGGTGEMSTQGLSFKLVRIGDKAYIYGSDAFYRKFAGAAAQLFHGKWLAFSATQGDFAALAKATDIGQFFALFKGKAGIVKGVETTVRGQKVIAIRDTKTGGGTMYVAVTGTPYPVEVIGSASYPGKLDFDEWNKPVALSAPKGAIDISKLKP
jgi:hypothetical protein